MRRLPLLRAPWSEAAPVRPSRAAAKAPAACSVESDLELDERAEEGGRLITRPKVHSRRRPHRVPNSTLQGGAAPLVVAVCAVGDHAVGTLPRSSAQNDITQLIPPLDAVPAVRGVRRHGVRPVIAHRQTEHGSGLGRYRWVVDRTFAWLHNFKRLLVRHERRADITTRFFPGRSNTARCLTTPGASMPRS